MTTFYRDLIYYPYVVEVPVIISQHELEHCQIGAIMLRVLIIELLISLFRVFVIY